MSRITLLIFVLVVLAFPASAETIRTWVESDGVVVFTNDLDPERVPEAYSSGAVDMEVDGMGDYEKFTPVVKSVDLAIRLERLRAFNSTNDFSKVEEGNCGTVSVRGERRDTDLGSKLFYVAEDDCGILYDSSQVPNLRIER